VTITYLTHMPVTRSDAKDYPPHSAESIPTGGDFMNKFSGGSIMRESNAIR
jgi:hypothetical protein